MTLFFDLDDTLVDSETAYTVGMKTVGIDPQDATFLKARALVKSDLPPLNPTARSRQLYFKKYLELKSKFSARRHIELAETYEKSVVTEMAHQWQQLQRHRLFDEIKKISTKIYLVTNETTRFQVQKLFAFDPGANIFTGLITSEECGVEKPNPHIFQQALARTQSQAKDSIMIGDSYINDIEGAIHCGIAAIQTLEFSVSDQKGPHTISDLNDLPAMIEKISSKK